MDMGKVLTGGVEGDRVDGHFFSQLQGAKASYSLTILFYIGADEEDLVFKFGDGYTLPVVCQLNAREGAVVERIACIVDDEVDAGSFCLQGIVEQLAKSGESVPVPGEQLFYYSGMSG